MIRLWHTIRTALLRRKLKHVTFLTVYLASFNKPRIYCHENNQIEEHCWRHS
jgi:hypothetical protein